jgi:hypothetical protein
LTKIKGLKIDDSAHTLSQELNFKDLTGLDLSGFDLLKREIAQAAIDKIIQRTLDGRNESGGSLGKYSESYKESLDFKAAGKSDPVDLKLSGDMLGSIDILDETDDTATIGFLGIEENAKAYAHETGFKGHPVLAGKVKPRPFFGVSQSELKDEINRKFKEDLEAVRVLSDLQPREERSALREAQNILRDILRKESDGV